VSNEFAGSNCRNAKVCTVTIDGPAAAGKSTVASLLSNRLGFFLLDSGALYRGVALHLTRSNVMPGSRAVPAEVLHALNLRLEPGIGHMRLFLGPEDVTDIIREEKVGEAASLFSAQPEVRQALLGLQRRIGSKWNLVAEGRDMGTVVFPDAAIKFFLTAEPAERAKRRHLELSERGEEFELETVQSEIRQRDHRDESRRTAPLAVPEGALVIDTTALSPEEVVDHMALLVGERLSNSGCD
jgi:CMP/dCMP kinase